MVKEAVSMEVALGHYGVKLRKVNRGYLRGMCPLPTHTTESSNESFRVNTLKNAWACQSNSCMSGRSGRKGGNVLDFVAAIEHCQRMLAWSRQPTGYYQQQAEDLVHDVFIQFSMHHPDQSAIQNIDAERFEESHSTSAEREEKHFPYSI